MNDTPTNDKVSAALVPIRDGLTPDQVDLLKTTICRGATDDELKLFINVCNKTRLDPFSKQIHAVKRWNAQSRREEMAIQIGIDGFRLTAQRSEQLDGQDGPYWCGPDGKWVDVWLEAFPPSAAKVIVFRKGCSHPFTGIARYDAYVQRNKEREPNRIWATMPDIMTAKCAEALALRKAFPAELSGIYAPEEMGQADSPAPEPSPLPAPRGSVATLGPPLSETEVSGSEWDKATPAKTVQNAPNASLGIQTPPTPEKSPISETGEVSKAITEKLWSVLKWFQCREGEPDRQLVTDFLRANKVIGPEQEPENWPAKWLPYRKPSHIRDLGFALANFKAGEPAQMPYPPNEFNASVTPAASPVGRVATSTAGPVARTSGSTPDTGSKWQAVSVPYGPIKGTALGQLPPDVQFDLWNTFTVSVTKGPDGKSQDLPVDRKFRDALDSMGVEKGFVKA